jgi:hypothetical protein
MSASIALRRLRELSPRLTARIAGALYFFTLISAQLLEWLSPNKVNLAAGVIELVGITIVTLMLYDLFKPVQRNLSLIAAVFNFLGLAMEAGRLASHGTDIAMVFHGIYCILIGYLILRSAFLPRVVGALIAFGGFSWLTDVSPTLANHISPYNLICGLAGEALMFLWLLVMGVNMERWRLRGDAPIASVIAT